MNISGISPLVSSIGQAGIADAIQLAVLKKAIDVNAQGAVQLIQAASHVINRNPPHLGNSVDISA